MSAPLHPIATAPRDGTSVDLHAIYEGIPDQRIDGFAWHPSARNIKDGFGLWVQDEGGVEWTECPDYGPTHWSERPS